MHTSFVLYGWHLNWQPSQYPFLFVSHVSPESKTPLPHFCEVVVVDDIVVVVVDLVVVEVVDLVVVVVVVLDEVVVVGRVVVVIGAEQEPKQQYLEES